MTIPWEYWYHCVGNTYGSWLPGDPRGFRMHHHRKHIDGDYKNPPPVGKYEYLHQYSTQTMKRDAVSLNLQEQQIVLDCFEDSLLMNEIPIAVMSVSATHAHILARFVRGRTTLSGKPIADPPRHYFGIARKRAARQLSDEGLISPGGVWSKSTTIVPIADERHFNNVLGYITRHEEEGAVIWTAPDAPPPDANG